MASGFFDDGGSQLHSEASNPFSEDLNQAHHGGGGGAPPRTRKRRPFFGQRRSMTPPPRHTVGGGGNRGYAGNEADAFRPAQNEVDNFLQSIKQRQRSEALLRQRRLDREAGEARAQLGGPGGGGGGDDNDDDDSDERRRRSNDEEELLSFEASDSEDRRLQTITRLGMEASAAADREQRRQAHAGRKRRVSQRNHGGDDDGDDDDGQEAEEVDEGRQGASRRGDFSDLAALMTDELVPVQHPRKRRRIQKLRDIGIDPDPSNDEPSACVICYSQSSEGLTALHQAIFDIEKFHRTDLPQEKLFLIMLHERQRIVERISKRCAVKFRPWTLQALYNHYNFHVVRPEIIMRDNIRELQTLLDTLSSNMYYMDPGQVNVPGAVPKPAVKMIGPYLNVASRLQKAVQDYHKHEQKRKARLGGAKDNLGDAACILKVNLDPLAVAYRKKGGVSNTVSGASANPMTNELSGAAARQSHASVRFDAVPS